MRSRRLGFLTTGAIVVTVGALVLPTAAFGATPKGKASPKSNLTNNSTVMVSAKGFPANDSLVIVECNSNAATSDQNACDTTVIVGVVANAKGVVAATPYTFRTGTIGDGTCNAKQTCYIVVTEPSSTGMHALIKVKVSKSA